MIHKAPLIPERVRRLKGSFATIEHRFLRDGFWQSLSHHELLLYFFLTLVGDHLGVSFYSYDRIITLLHLRLDEYIQARDATLAVASFDCGSMIRAMIMANMSESSRLLSEEMM